MPIAGLNAPYGARCFLTKHRESSTCSRRVVLMHLMALDTF